MGSFGISEDNITGREKKKKNLQIMRLTAIPSGEVDLTFPYTSSKQGLNKEARGLLA